jgi:hypothetical protein
MYEQAQDNISQNYIAEANALQSRNLSPESYQEERARVRSERDELLAENSHLYTGALVVRREHRNGSNEIPFFMASSPSTDYNQFDSSSPVPGPNSDQDNVSSTQQDNVSSQSDSLGKVEGNSNESSNKRSLPEDSDSENNSGESSNKRFKQDSSDIMPDTEPMDFDDPTG